MIGYRRRVSADVKRWQDAGWITPEGARAIDGDLARRGARFGLPQVLGLLGGVLLCLAAMTFVASNWEAMPRLLRLGILLAALWGSFGAAFVLFLRDHAWFGHAAVLTGCGVFGAAIMLIAQMYHIEGNPPDAVLTWGLGCALAGVALRSNPALVLAALLLGLWSAWVSSLNLSVHWLFLPAWGALVVASLLVSRWPRLFNLLSLLLAGWVFSLGIYWYGPKIFNRGIEQGPFFTIFVVGLVFAGLAALARPWIDRIVAVGQVATAQMLAVSFIGLWALQFVSRHQNVASLGMWFILALAGLVVLVAYAVRTGNLPVLWVAYAGFAIELVSIYFKTLGTLLNTSLFFLSAGVLVIGLAWAAWKLHQRTPAIGAAS